jgi:hypothetical protein
MDNLGNIFLSPEVFVSLFVSFLLLIILTIAAFQAITILRRYIPNAVTQEQYKLEKKSYLVTTIIQISLFVNIFLLAYFAYTLNALSTIIPGAMCGAGVISSNGFGNPLIVLKICIIILSMVWLAINREDFLAKRHPYFTIKLYFFLFIFFLLLIDFFLAINFFSNLSTVAPVLCCSNIYKNPTGSMPFNLQTSSIITLFYLLYFILVLLLHYKKRVLIAAFSIAYLYIAYLSITYFFSTYIYELPTHKCPYCILDADYYYIGYFIYGSLFIATFYALTAVVLPYKKDLFQKAIFLYSLFLLLASFKFIYYFILNQTFL